MHTTSKLTVIAFVLVAIIVVFEKSLYIHVIWLSIALIGVVAMLILHGTEASERLPNKVLKLIPRMLLGISSLAVGMLVLAALYGAATSDELSEWNVFYTIGMFFVTGLFLYVGVSWLRQAAKNATQNDSAKHIHSKAPEDRDGN